MKPELYRYDIFPKVFLTNTETDMTLQPLGLHAAFDAQKTYTVQFYKLGDANPRAYGDIPRPAPIAVVPSEDGCLRFKLLADSEDEYYVQVYDDPEQKPLVTMSVYVLNADMAGRIPLRGDLHMHTCRSDGKEAPAVVAANYRGHGYDFFAITDHHRYYPSMEAIEIWRELSDFNIVEGEEVHLPLNDVHYVNFGGSFSINALITPNGNQEKDGDSLSWRSRNGSAPETMTKEEFCAMIRERAKSIPLPYESERLSYAVLEWTYEQIRAAGGLGIFPHPYWRCQMMQLPEDYVQYIYQNKPFDAFEVLGGENYYMHNGFQSALYYEMKAKGIDHPIVGSTDSHGSTEHNRNALICSTIVFAKKNEREAIIDAIKSKYSVAVDSISKEYRLVGDLRLQKYASFLMENYFPLHDLACQAEGYYMNRYLANDDRAVDVLRSMRGQIPDMQKRYFAV